MKKLLLLALMVVATSITAQKFDKKIESLASKYENDAIELRHWFHENAELSNREFKTSEKIAETLRAIGYEPQTGIAKTGVVAILEGGKPGPVVGLRADIDGLPVKERVDIPWASKMMGEYNGQEVPVMHACGHDTHVGILLGVAKMLYEIKDEVPGTVKFIFQPAEEEAPAESEDAGETEGEASDAEEDVEAKVRKSVKAEIAELSKACDVAGMPEKLGEFIEKGYSAEQAKDELMKLMANSDEKTEIHSQTTPAASAENEQNPVVETAKARAEAAQQ